MRKLKKLRVTIAIFLILIISWGTIVFVNYSLSMKAKPPIFSMENTVMDTDRYWGLGYTIILRYRGPIGMSGEELKGYFYWGWR